MLLYRAGVGDARAGTLATSWSSPEQRVESRYCTPAVTRSLATLTLAVTTSGSLSCPRVRRRESWVSTTGVREDREDR